jgi:hypothetical protein
VPTGPTFARQNLQNAPMTNEERFQKHERQLTHLQLFVTLLVDYIDALEKGGVVMTTKLGQESKATREKINKQLQSMPWLP